MNEKLLERFAKEYFLWVDNMPSDAWGRLSLRVKNEHLKKMEQILTIAEPLIRQDERERILDWVKANTKVDLSLLPNFALKATEGK